MNNPSKTENYLMVLLVAVTIGASIALLLSLYSLGFDDDKDAARTDVIASSVALVVTGFIWLLMARLKRNR
jgi:hypothetical protein